MCCPGDTFPANNKCPCDSSTTCCDYLGDTFPTNLRCPPPCDPKLYCCEGESWELNKNCPCPDFQPKCHEICVDGPCVNECDSNTLCCKGDNHISNPLHCLCDSREYCCTSNGDTWLTNPLRCKCDSNVYCCPLQTWRENVLCTPCNPMHECCNEEFFW